MNTSVGDIVNLLPFGMAQSMTLNANQYRDTDQELHFVATSHTEVMSQQGETGEVWIRRGTVTTVGSDSVKIWALCMGFSYMATLAVIALLVIYIINRDSKLRNKHTL
jgi:hypothetical protein